MKEVLIPHPCIPYERKESLQAQSRQPVETSITIAVDGSATPDLLDYLVG